MNTDKLKELEEKAYRLRDDAATLADVICRLIQEQIKKESKGDR